MIGHSLTVAATAASLPSSIELRERLALAGGLGPLGFRRLGRARAFEVMAVIGRLPKRVTYPGYVQRPPFQRYGASQDINEPGCLAVVLAHRYPRCDFSESRVRFLALHPARSVSEARCALRAVAGHRGTGAPSLLTRCRRPRRSQVPIVTRRMDPPAEPTDNRSGARQNRARGAPESRPWPPGGGI